jgi:hypothetical protein
MQGEVGALREVLAEEAVGVLVGAALPRGMRVAELVAIGAERGALLRTEPGLDGAIPAAFANGTVRHINGDPATERVPRCRALRLPDPPSEPWFKEFRPFWPVLWTSVA